MLRNFALPLAASLPVSTALSVAVSVAHMISAPIARAETFAAPANATARGPVSKLILALRLQAEAEARQDALALAVAADMAAKVQLREATGWAPQVIKTSPFAADAFPAAMPAADQNTALPPGAALVFLQSGEAMAAALLLAEEDDALSDVLVPLAGSAGWHHTGAVTQTEAELPAKGAQDWQLAFDGQSPAEIAVLTLGTGAAWWQVTDAQGQVICPGQPAHEARICRFTPEVNSFFHVTVAGAAEAPGALRYLLMTN